MENNDGEEREADVSPKITTQSANATANGFSAKAAVPAPPTAKTGRGTLGRLWERVRPSGSARKDATSVVAVMPVDIPEPVSDPVEEVTKSAAIQVQVEAARWSRRRDVPLAILAWSGVVILIIWLAGHIATTILLLIIAMLLAYALAPAVGILARVMPRFLAILIVYLIFLGGIGGLIYLIIRTAVDQVSSLSHYVNFLLTVGKGNRVSPLEQFLNSLGISSSQIDSYRNQIILSLIHI